MTWKIQAINSELGGQDILIDRDMLVGRHQDADIVLQFGEISRRHAAFLLKDQTLYLKDLSSSNGTFVNNLRIIEDTLLKDGDTIAFATLPFVVMFEQTEVNTMAAEQTAAAIAVEQQITQPSEAVACSENLGVPEPTAAESVVEPALESNVVEPVKAAAALETEAVAEPQAQTEPVAEPVPPVSSQDSAAKQMSEQGMPDVTERAAGTVLSKEGTPAHVDIPKPAPIPENRELAEKVAAESVVPATETQAATPVEDKKNASVGLITIVVLVILAIMAWLFLK